MGFFDTLGKIAKVAAIPVGVVNPAAGLALGAAGGLASGGVRGGLEGAAMGGGGALLGASGGLRKLSSLGLSPLDIAQLGIAGLGAVQAGQASGRASDLQEEALRVARAEAAQRAPFRDAASDLLLSGMPTERPDLSSAFAGSSNPFARPLERPTVPGAQAVRSRPSAVTRTGLPPATGNLRFAMQDAFPGVGMPARDDRFPQFGGTFRLRRMREMGL